MKLLFIPSLIGRDWDRLHDLSLVLVVFYICVLGAILIDLWSGIDRAKRENILRTSFGFRQTIKKVKDYFSVLMLFSIADVVASVWFSLPFFSAIGTIGIIFVEARSVYENKKDVNKGIKDLPEAIARILKNKDDVKALLYSLEFDERKKKQKTN